MDNNNNNELDNTSGNYIESPGNYVQSNKDINIGIADTIFLMLESIPIIGIIFIPIEWLFDIIRWLFKANE